MSDRRPVAIALLALAALLGAAAPVAADVAEPAEQGPASADVTSAPAAQDPGAPDVRAPESAADPAEGDPGEPDDPAATGDAAGSADPAVTGDAAGSADPAATGGAAGSADPAATGDAAGSADPAATGDLGETPADPAGALEAYDPLFDAEHERQDAFDADPLEPANRWAFAFNEGLGRWVLDPITYGYQWLVPDPARRGVSRVFRNLNAPVIFANELLQLRPVPAATTASRFVVNSTLGLAGIFDVADEVMGMPAGAADFGQTLARYGVPRGPYLVVPLFGPSTARDAVGTVADQMLDPLTYLIGPLNLQWQLLRGSEGLVLRDRNIDSLDALRESSVDFYAALRSAYLQNRRAMELEATGGEAPPVPARAEPAPQDSLPEASFSMRSSMAAISPAKSSRLTMLENSERRSASSLTVPSR